MPDLTVLLDQNVPREIAAWLKTRKPDWVVLHTSEAGLSTESDATIYLWATEKKAVIVTFDEDFADRRSFPVSSACGVVRLRVWPTTTEETQSALDRLLQEVTDVELLGALVIIDRTRIRIRRVRD